MSRRSGTICSTSFSRLPDSRPDNIAVSLNFSGRQISDTKLAPRILEILKRAGFPPPRLMVEVTESAVVQRLEDAKASLQALREVGVRIALDDFGTGYSGLYHLRELELDTIKIDRTFVWQMLEKPQEARIVKAIVSLGHALGLKTTAEGIQSEDTVGRLLKLGCDTGQGYLFGQPQPASVVTEALREAADGRDGAPVRPRRIA
ncbi:MAG TPA: EAL domain-containing protein [Methyloceanibacter sp.]|nr:EAL domain-containing protein [Methyloceanibacter sp.]